MKTVLLAAAFTSILFSCQKSPNDIVQPQPAMDDLIGKYRITKLVFQSKGNPDVNMLSGWPECAADDLLVFAADSLFTREDAGVSCDQNDIESTVWFTKGNKLNIDGVESDIVSYDKHTLVITTRMMMEDVQGTVSETLEKQ